MKYRSTNKWVSIKASRNLLFFAQLLDELLFDYSLDTYKPSAMNTSLLCLEALETIFEIDEGNIKRPNLQHILDELCENLAKDLVAKNLIKIDLDGVYAALKDPKVSFHEKKVVVELLARQLNLRSYKSKNEELLSNEVKSSDGVLSTIRSLSRSYVTTLINMGFSQRYIYKLLHDFFFYGSNVIQGNEAIDTFIGLFSADKNEYIALYRGSDVFLKITASCNPFDIGVTRDIKDIGSYDLSGHKFELRNDEVYICVNKIESRDQFAAKERADARLDLLSTLHTLFFHKKHLEILRDCLVINTNAGTVHKSNTSINAMHKCIDHKPKKAATKLNRFVSEFSLRKASFKKFTRSAELHSLALASDSKENQMINLWIALESIIPSKSEESKLSNIAHIINSIIPFLNIGYLDRLMSRLASDLLNWNKNLVRNSIRGVPGNGIAEKLVRIMSLKEHVKQRENLKSSFNDFHLLSDRFSYFCNVLSEPANVVKLLDNHEKRVAWQLRRIYRARNLIVHSGKTPTYTEILIENTHDYLDVVMGSIMRLATNPRAIYSIEQGFTYVSLSYSSLYKQLSKKGEIFDECSIQRLIEAKII